MEEDGDEEVIDSGYASYGLVLKMPWQRITLWLLMPLNFLKVK